MGDLGFCRAVLVELKKVSSLFFHRLLWLAPAACHQMPSVAVLNSNRGGSGTGDPNPKPYPPPQPRNAKPPAKTRRGQRAPTGYGGNGCRAGLSFNVGFLPGYRALGFRLVWVYFRTRARN